MKKWKCIVLGCLIFLATERFCYFQTGTFSLSKMMQEGSPPSPTLANSSVVLEQPLHFLGAGKQFYAFETADGKYVVKFMKWSRRRPLPFLEKIAHPAIQNYLAQRARLASNLQKSSQLALNNLTSETLLVIPQPSEKFILIDKLGISHTVQSSSIHYYVQHKATPFIDYFESHLVDAHRLLHSFVHTVANQCRKGISNLDPLIDRNYGVAQHRVILLDIGSFLASSKLKSVAAIKQEIVLELLPLRAWLQENYPEYLSTLDALLVQELDLID